MTVCLLDTVSVSAETLTHTNTTFIIPSRVFEKKPKNNPLEIELLADSNSDIKEISFDEIEFAEYECPESFLQAYEEINVNICLIQNNVKNIKRLAQRYLSSTQKEDENEIMKEMHLVVTKNNQIAKEIQQQLETEKLNNAEYSFPLSNIGRWCVNKLNTCVRNFKISTLEFSREWNSFNSTLRHKLRRYIDIVDNGQMTEQEKDELAMDYDRANQFIENKLTSDDHLDMKLGNVEDIKKIEKSMEELLLLRQASEILITFDDQDTSDSIVYNVSITRDFVQDVYHHLVVPEERRKCSRKMRLTSFCCCSLVFIIVFVAVFLAISDWNSKQ